MLQVLQFGMRLFQVLQFGDEAALEVCNSPINSS